MTAVAHDARVVLVDALDEAVARDCPHELTKCLRNAVCELMRDPRFELPDEVFTSCRDHYARRELYQSERFGYSVVAMTWGPGQGTPIHDHAGLWCVEGVFEGALEVVQYELTEQRDDHYRFEPVGVIQANAGSAGSLIPPHEYHTICNASDRAMAISLHIYADRMERCNVFTKTGDDWYSRGACQLSLD